MVRVIVLTGSETRHQFFRKALALAEGIEVLASYCEGLERNIRHVIDPMVEGADLQLRHIAARDRSEEDFFGSFVRLTPDRSNPISLVKGAINDEARFAEISRLQPDLLVAYGCSIITDPLLSAFSGRFVNVHLGLSPYYRGAGTNFWPLVNGEPEFVGATFMHMDAGIDTGAIIHQIRARVFAGDRPHDIGNRLIGDMTDHYIALVRQFRQLGDPPVPPSAEGRLYKRKDFTVEAVERLYANFEGGMVTRYLEEREEREARAPVVVHPLLAGKVSA